MGNAGIGRRFDEFYRCDLEVHDILKGMNGSWRRCDRKRRRQDMLELRRGQRHQCALAKVAFMGGSCCALFIQPLLFGSFAFDVCFWTQSNIPLSKAQVPNTKCWTNRVQSSTTAKQPKSNLACLRSTISSLVVSVSTYTRDTDDCY